MIHAYIEIPSGFVGIPRRLLDSWISPEEFYCQEKIKTNRPSISDELRMKDNLHQQLGIKNQPPWLGHIERRFEYKSKILK